jgi:L-alanine-DL-glutamate epimerase-like enolase superfamily enzyme
MIIRRLETYTTQSLSVVRAVAEDGSEGWGQMSPFNADISAMVFHRQIARHVLGQDAEPTEALVDRILGANLKFPGTYVLRALCGVETALWDLKAKREGRPVYALLGGQSRPIPCYGSSMRRDISPADEAQRLARRRQEQGFGAFKIKIGMDYGHDVDASAGRTEALIEAVRRELGDQVALLADANSGFAPQRAIAVGRLLEQHGYVHFEEPCPWWEYEQTAEVRAALDIDVTGGEQDFFMPAWKHMIAIRAVDIVQPDVCYMGGMIRTRQVAALAAQAGMLCVPHSANQSMVQVFTMHLALALPNFGRYMEYSIEDGNWHQGLYDPVPQVAEGQTRVSEEPGWGVRIRPDWLERAERQVSEVS